MLQSGGELVHRREFRPENSCLWYRDDVFVGVGLGGVGGREFWNWRMLSTMESVDVKNAHSFYEPFYLYCLFFLVNIETLNIWHLWMLHLCVPFKDWIQAYSSSSSSLVLQPNWGLDHVNSASPLAFQRAIPAICRNRLYLSILSQAALKSVHKWRYPYFVRLSRLVPCDCSLRILGGVSFVTRMGLSDLCSNLLSIYVWEIAPNLSSVGGVPALRPPLA